MYVQRNIEGRSCSSSYSWKAISIEQPECVFVALGTLVIQHAMRMHYIVICGLPLSTKFFHIIS